jgi:hypothetical protein
MRGGNTNHAVEFDRRRLVGNAWTIRQQTLQIPRDKGMYHVGLDRIQLVSFAGLRQDTTMLGVAWTMRGGRVSTETKKGMLPG